MKEAGLEEYPYVAGLIVDARERIQEIYFEETTPLYRAVESGDLEEVTALLERGSDPDKPPSAWSAACYKGDVAIASVLLRYGADISSLLPNTASATCLHIAANKGHRDLIRELVSAGADVNAQTLWMKTPMDWADDPSIKSYIGSLGGRSVNPFSANAVIGALMAYGAYQGGKKAVEHVKDVFQTGQELSSVYIAMFDFKLPSGTYRVEFENRSSSVRRGLGHTVDFREGKDPNVSFSVSLEPNESWDLIFMRDDKEWLRVESFRSASNCADAAVYFYPTYKEVKCN